MSNLKISTYRKKVACPLFPKAAAIIVAAGASRRFKSKTSKQLFPLRDVPVFIWSVAAFRKTKNFSQIIVVVPKKSIELFRKYGSKYKIDVIAGGKERVDSVRQGLKHLNSDIEYVAIHDGARPLITPQLIKRNLSQTLKHGATVCAVQARDTVKISAPYGFVKKTTPRQNIWLAQTPQTFRCSIIKSAYKKLKTRKITDDAQAVELLGRKVKIVPGDYFNIKITEQKDIAFAENILKLTGSGLES